MMPMNATILIDNTPHPTKSLASEHGLSMYFEIDGLKCLLDVGASPLFEENARSLGISIEAVDYLFLSHAHSDHLGGLARFLEVNSHAKVFLSCRMRGQQFFSTRGEKKHFIGFDSTLFATHSARLCWMDGTNVALTPHLVVLGNIPLHYSIPKANRTLRIFDESTGIETADLFAHEMALAVRSAKGWIVFSGCSHRGLLNILTEAKHYIESIDNTSSNSIIACIGGTHLLDSIENYAFESDEEIATIADILLSNYPQMALYTGHCTGAKVQQLLHKKLGIQMDAFYTGASYNF